jgi:inner membrane protein
MDPISQGAVAAVVAQQPAKFKNILVVTVLGFLSGMAPDLDIFIRSSSDPLLTLEFHRQFTHSLLFIPIGGFVCGAFFYNLFAKRFGLNFLSTYYICTLGYATHGFLDACTSYGTQLLWPFSNDRISWNTISIIDPVFTIPILLLIVLYVYKKNKIFCRLALAWIMLYILFGHVQHERAKNILEDIAISRDHKIIRAEVKPSFGNIIVWKIIYSTKNSFYVDAVKLGYKTKFYEGSKIDKLSIKDAFPWLDYSSQQAKDIDRFRWFSNEFIALDEKFKNRIIDIRYSMLPNEIKGLWGIELDELANSDSHVTYVFNREKNLDKIKKLIKMIKE